MWILKCPNFRLQWLIECHSHISYKSQMPKGKDSQHLLCSHPGSLELWRTWWEIETLGSSRRNCGVFWCDIRVTRFWCKATIATSKWIRNDGKLLNMLILFQVLSKRLDLFFVRLEIKSPVHPREQHALRRSCWRSHSSMAAMMQ